ncbi:MAG: hypothetical protein SGI71_13170 [Verrucomicrobiota bacterium]|nr:hypothetical protein [Verrucomicrobiota bacterium]
MKSLKKCNFLLDKMFQIQEMEKGTLSLIRGRYYNLQYWENGRNVSRYVSKDEAPEIKKALKGYRQYIKLSEQYASLIILQTRKKLKNEHQKPKNKGI